MGSAFFFLNREELKFPGCDYSLSPESRHAAPSFHRVPFVFNKTKCNKIIHDAQLRWSGCWANADITAIKVKFNDAE